MDSVVPRSADIAIHYHYATLAHCLAFGANTASYNKCIGIPRLIKVPNYYSYFCGAKFSWMEAYLQNHENMALYSNCFFVV